MALSAHSLALGAPSRMLEVRSRIHALPSSIYFKRTKLSRLATCNAADMSAGFGSGAEENPYEVLGVNPLESFDKIKVLYSRKHKDAEKSGNEAAAARLERAYDKIMMSQLSKRKKGLTFGAVEVSKNIKYADKQPLLPWGPKKARSIKRDIMINVGISVAMSVWVVISEGMADWKPLQVLIFGYVFQLFNKLKQYEPPDVTVYDEEDHNKNVAKSGKRLLRTFGLVFGCVTVASLVFTGILNGIEIIGASIPRALYNSQETFVTIVSAVLMFFVGSFYR
ncbi:uncharacterized protein LOC9647459 isoform X1 [Selaginella moellendorffii]|nr:uncharacterized protein LOC9647459 isoform X1 [Selaginella moellendorffii]|eukprot:XP_024542162.1 uncharacterized protein LOC9647459 isoform X1 [Selaginella moellendorffii]